MPKLWKIEQKRSRALSCSADGQNQLIKGPNVRHEGPLNGIILTPRFSLFSSSCKSMGYEGEDFCVGNNGKWDIKCVLLSCVISRRDNLAPSDGGVCSQVAAFMIASYQQSSPCAQIIYSMIQDYNQRKQRKQRGAESLRSTRNVPLGIRRKIVGTKRKNASLISLFR